MRCDKCVHWDTNTKDNLLDDSIRKCNKPIMFWSATEWKEVGDDYGRVRIDKYADLKMFVEDGSDYYAALLTTADFYCAHFEEKKQ